MESEEISRRVVEYRTKNGLTQEQLAERCGLNLRTVQRIEKGKNVPRGDTLRRLAVALNTSPDELIDWKTAEDKNVLTLLNLSQLSFLAFPILGIIVPLVIWVFQKDKVKNVDHLGKSILNFQISLTILFFILPVSLIFTPLHMPSRLEFRLALTLLILLYFYILFLILYNAVRIWQDKSTFYRPAFKFLK